VPVQLRPEVQAQLARQVDDLTAELHGAVSRETVERTLQESVATLEDARFDDFIPVLAYRYARERLREHDERG
jgi:hypothetical protein